MVAASLLAAFWAAFVLALVSPGPNFAVLLGTALQRGRAAAVKVAFGMAIGEAVWGFAAVFGVALLAARHPWIGTGLRVGGGMFLLYLAFLSIRAALRRTEPEAEPAGEPAPSPAAARGGIARGFGLMLLNPKAGVFWVSLTSVFLTPETPASVGVIAVAGAVLLSLGWHTMLAVALSADAVTAAYRRLRRGLEATLGVVLAGLGLRLLVSN
ncbi:LysE family transporter [Skermanella mucosa]|uniref:LysE family transporter n=1 Tax=Skermanella mucosa TaxID=1789672 RepID=UPI00192ADFC7|nr:LysE family transporter [Skermanella mucosa]UEM21055.1 LysE family transporter [Skermanella mucosa]